MRFFDTREERTPQQFSMQSGPPQSGPQSALAGVAEKGDRLDVLGHGSYINRGSKASPRWVKLSDAAPSSATGDWRPLAGADRTGRQQ
jgi:hypothetical protein